MADDDGIDAALRPLAPGVLLEIGNADLRVQVAPAAGGRIAQIHRKGTPWLCGHDADTAAIAWGCYPMLPWAGRIRQGRFGFEGRELQLPTTLGAHAIHGFGFLSPWRVESHARDRVEMSLQLPRDGAWPFGGEARQRMQVAGGTLRLELSLTADELPMPRPVLGWHPWFIKPQTLEFRPVARYPRDAQGIATLPLVAPGIGPWDDCFINSAPVALRRAGQLLRLRSVFTHWVVFDERAHATCVEPQSGPPDAFNLQPQRLRPHESVQGWFELEWQTEAAAG